MTSARGLIVVAYHDVANMDSFPEHEWIRKVDLNSLNIGRPQWFTEGADYRITLDRSALIDACNVAIISGRFFSRLSSPPSLATLKLHVESLKENQFMAFQGSLGWGIESIKLWLEQQDFNHPGMANILHSVIDEFGLQPKRTPFVLAMGGQIASHSENLLELSEFMDKSIGFVHKAFGMKPEFRYRCQRCHAINDTGFGRWTSSRHLGYLLERLQALHFATSGLEPVMHIEGDNFTNVEKRKVLGRDYIGAKIGALSHFLATARPSESPKTCDHLFSYARSE